MAFELDVSSCCKEMMRYAKQSLETKSLKIITFVRFYSLFYRMGQVSEFLKISYLDGHIYEYQGLHYMMIGKSKILLSPYHPECYSDKITVSEQEFNKRINRKIEQIFGDFDWNNIVLFGSAIGHFLETRESKLLNIDFLILGGFGNNTQQDAKYL